MRAVVHFGMSKTGSTALQKSLAQSRGALSRAGLLYPDLTRQPHHAYLLPSLMVDGEWKREFGENTPKNVDRVRATSARSWEILDAQIARHKGDTTIISSEHALGLRRDSKKALYDQLAARFEEIDFVGYVRSPVSHYLSNVQQTVKFSATFRAPGVDLRFRQKLTSISDATQTRPRVRLFRRDQLEKECISTDFMKHFLGHDLAKVGVRPVSDNSTLSAEGMALIQEFNRVAWSGRVPFNSSVNRTLIRMIQFEERKRPYYTKPRLRPEAAAAQSAANAENVSWLSHVYGLDLEEGYPEVQGASLRNWLGSEELLVQDICFVDLEKLNDMRVRLMKKLLSELDHKDAAP